MKNFIYFLLGLLISVIITVPFSHADLCGSGQINTQKYTTFNTVAQSGTVATFSGKDNSQNDVVTTSTNVSLLLGNATLPSYVNYSGGKYYYTYSITCTPSQPDHCTDNVKSGDELALDCGGSCSTACDQSCDVANGYMQITLNGVVSCSKVYDVDAFGNCSGGVADYRMFDGDRFCQNDSDIVYSPPQTTPVYDDSIVTGGGTFNIVHTPETVVDNGDGTETATLKTQITNPDGSKTDKTSKVDRPSGSPSGTGFIVNGSGGVGIAPGFSGSSEGDVDASGIAGSSESDQLDFEDRLSVTLDSAKSEFQSHVDTVLNSDFVQIMGDILTVPQDTLSDDTTIQVDFGSYGHMPISLNKSDETWELLASVLKVCAFLAGGFIIFRKQ